MQESQFAGLLMLAVGAFAIIAAIVDWELFMNSRKARPWVKLIGRNNARLLYGGLGTLFCLIGLFMVIAAPGDAAPESSPVALGEVAGNDGRSSTPGGGSSPAADSAFSGSETSQKSDPQAATSTSQATLDLRKESPDGVVDLLELIEPARDQLEGEWKMEDGNLISPNRRPAILQIPVAPPEEYVVKAVVEELEGDESFSMGLVVGGHGVTAVIAGSGGDLSGLNLVDGKIARVNSTRTAGPALGSGQNTIVCTVTGDSLTVQCNDRTVLQWTGDPSRLSYGYEWKQGGQNHLKVGSWSTSCRISELVLMPKSAAGE